MNFKSIKVKMLTMLITLVTLTCFGLSASSYHMSKKALESSTKELMQQISEQTAKNIELSIQSNFSVLESVSSNEIIKDPNAPWENKKKRLEEEIKAHGHLVLGIADKEGNIIYTDGKSNNIKDRDYFKGAMEGKDTVSEPFVSKIDNVNLFMPYAVPIRNDGEVVGVLVALRDGNDLGKACAEVKFKESGQAYIIGKTGDVIAHKNRELVLKKDNVQKSSKEDKGLEPLAAIERDMMAGRTGVGEYSYNKVSKLIGYAPIGTTGWSLGIFIEEEEALAAVSTIRLNEIIISIVSIAACIVAVWIMSSVLARVLNYIKGHIDHMAKGNLSLSLDEKYLKMESEIGDMARSLETSRKSIAAMIDSIKVNSDTIDSQATSLASISEEFTASTQNISGAIQQVATGSSTQAEDLSDIVSLIQQFGVELDEVAKSIGDIDFMSKEVSNKANMSNEDMEKVVVSVERLTESFYDFAKKISNMSQNIQKVNEITDLINSIAEQTNLLALNAAIEAARAGEAGRGFAVVAEEIRGLAERSKESSENIYVLINSVLEDANRMVAGTDSMNHELQNQKLSIDTAIESFKAIATSIVNIEPKIAEVTSTAKSIDEKKNSILDKTEAISSISEEISASSQEIAASSEQMSSSSLEVSQAAEKLNTMTEEVLNKVNEFKI